MCMSRKSVLYLLKQVLGAKHCNPPWYLYLHLKTVKVCWWVMTHTGEQTLSRQPWSQEVLWGIDSVCLISDPAIVHKNCMVYNDSKIRAHGATSGRGRHLGNLSSHEISESGAVMMEMSSHPFSVIIIFHYHQPQPHHPSRHHHHHSSLFMKSDLVLRILYSRMYLTPPQPKEPRTMFCARQFCFPTSPSWGACSGPVTPTQKAKQSHTSFLQPLPKDNHVLDHVPNVKSSESPLNETRYKTDLKGAQPSSCTLAAAPEASESLG